MYELEIWGLLSMASFGAGVLNALAGGGTFLTLPALLFAGMPPVSANTTSTAAVLPGYASAAFGFRQTLTQVPRRRLVLLIVATVVGSIVGANLLLETSNEVFNILAPFLILFATSLFVLGPRMKKWVEKKGGSNTVGLLGIGTLSGYGGYFNGGLGIALLTVLSFSGSKDLYEANGLKSLLSVVLTVVSVSIYALSGSIEWPVALGMMLFCSAGGYLGARLALKLPTHLLRSFIVMLGVFMSVALFANNALAAEKANSFDEQESLATPPKRTGFDAIRNLDYTIILCDDVRVMRDFYTSVLQFKVDHETPGAWVALRVGSSLLTLRPRNRPYDGPKSPEKSASLQLAFRVPPQDVDRAYETLKRLGISVIEPPANQPWGHRTLFFADPEYNVVEIYADI